MRGAQRLPASKVPSLLLRVVPDLQRLVLNAFRRRRFHHPRCQPASASSPRAQRLPASKVPSPPLGIETLGFATVLNAFRRRRFHHRDRSHSSSSRATGAQRLPASKVPSRDPHFPRRAANSSCSTPSGVEGSITGSNAAVSGWNRCSTPSGVEGSITLRPPVGLDVRPEVLNAFRRRRFHHIGHGNNSELHRCAQRLPASKVPSRLHVGRREIRLRLVLNAFRRRRFHHRSRWSGTW